MKQNDMLEKAVKVFQSGGIIIYPTDTAFGIGCRIDSKESVDRLFKLRKRSVDHATPVLVSSIDMARTYFLNPPKVVFTLMEKYWPGALTIISFCDSHKVYSPIRGGTGNIGLRMPNHKIPLTLIRQLGVPILGPSANFHGDKTPYVYEKLDARLTALVDLVVPGTCVVKQASTVVDCTKNPVVIVRTGAVQLLEEDVYI
ncbi:threonylcarbamoyl-AMP synthase [Candidatus Gottesmanbacteria bacterium]|nr:threonylcarbamoyl-AMP synthase [Candidatus Gottesmanbacteria bacterium]